MTINSKSCYHEQLLGVCLGEVGMVSIFFKEIYFLLSVLVFACMSVSAPYACLELVEGSQKEGVALPSLGVTDGLGTPCGY